MRYKRLPGKGRNVAGVSRLYTADDHLLLVHSTRLTEDYRRFYFQDIQAITARRSAPFHYGWTAALVLLALVAGVITRELFWGLGIGAAGALLLWWRGPTSVVEIQTAVTLERLPSLHRWRTAVRALSILGDRIEAVQGRVEWAPDVVPDPDAPAVRPLPPVPPLSARGTRRDAMLLFGYLGAEAALAGAWLITGVRTLDVALGVTTLVEFLLLVTVLVRQSRAPITRSLRVVTFSALGRWILLQVASSAVAYKDYALGVRRVIDPFRLVGPWEGQIAFATLLITSIAGFWATLERANE
jgi:hypothetical protein